MNAFATEIQFYEAGETVLFLVTLTMCLGAIIWLIVQLRSK